MLPFLLETYSDELGNYAFYNVPNGTYNILADNFGYKIRYQIVATFNRI